MDFVRRSKINLFLGVVCSGVLASLLYLYIYIYVVYVPLSENYISGIIGFLGVIFFATIPIFGIYKYFLHGSQQQKILSIDESGIKFYSGARFTLFWHDIESISKESAGQGKGQALAIHLKHGDSKRFSTKRKAKLLYFPDKKYAGPGDITIAFHGVSPSLDDAIAEITKYRSKAVNDVAV